MNQAVLRRVALEAAPAAVVAVAVSVVMSSAVPELDGRLPLLLVAGLVAVAAAAWVLERQAVAAPAAPEPAARPVLRAVPTPPVEAPATVAPVLAAFEVLTLAKEGSSPDENEDAAAVDEQRGAIAVSDGASSSFAARVWSAALVETALSLRSSADQRAIEAIVERAAATWRAAHEGADVAWWAQEGLRKGAFATLLLVHIGEADGRLGWTATAVGDSNLFHLRHLDRWTIVRSFPVETAEGFGSHPHLLGSSGSPVGGVVHASGELQDGDVIVAATDAVSEWVLSDPSRIPLLATAPLAELEPVLRGARIDHTMVNDDVTLVRHRVGGTR